MLFSLYTYTSEKVLTMTDAPSPSCPCFAYPLKRPRLWSSSGFKASLAKTDYNATENAEMSALMSTVRWVTVTTALNKVCDDSSKQSVYHQVVAMLRSSGWGTDRSGGSYVNFFTKKALKFCKFLSFDIYFVYIFCGGCFNQELANCGPQKRIL